MWAENQLEDPKTWVPNRLEMAGSKTHRKSRRRPAREGEASLQSEKGFSQKTHRGSLAVAAFRGADLS